MVIPAGTLPPAAVRLARDALRRAGVPDADWDAAVLVGLATGRAPRFDEAPLTAAQAECLSGLLRRRCAREPLQYLSGKWDFLSVTLKVGPGVLCPRPDTEILCEQAARLLQGRRSPVVLDLCAGTGCVGIGIGQLAPAAQVTCVERSAHAFAYLAENAARYGVAAVRGDLFGYERQLAPESLDLIAANPPYLTQAEMEDLQPETAREPAMALAGGEDGLDFYRYLAAHYRNCLRPDGWLAVEIGWQQRQAVEDLLRGAGWGEPVCRQDYAGHDRVILAPKSRFDPIDRTDRVVLMTNNNQRL